MSLINKLPLIGPTNISKLFELRASYYNQEDIKKQIKRIYKSLAIWMILLATEYTLLAKLIINPILTKRRHSLIGAAILVEIIASIILNKNFHYETGRLLHKFLNKYTEEIRNYLDEEYRQKLNTILSLWNNYWMSIAVLGHLIINLPFTYVLLVRQNKIGEGSPETLIILTLLLVMLVYAGDAFAKANQQIIKDWEKGKNPAKTNIRKRLFMPTVTNVMKTTALPLLALGAGTGAAPLFIFMTGIAENFWTLIQKGNTLRLTKEYLLKINKHLEEVQERYICNEKTYQIQAQRVQPTIKLLKKSEKNKSLIVKDFVPMARKNREKVTHKYSFDFHPGLYQIQGINGIGKTTFMKSLALPKGIPVEFSEGKAALEGKPLYDPEGSLEQHRKNIFYIGSHSTQDQTENLKLDFNLEKYPTIKKILKNIEEEKHTIQSEGEKGLVNICKAVEKTKEGKEIKIILIDEILSRLYDNEKYPLRTEVITLLQDCIQNHKSIVIIVDHMTTVEQATQLHMERKDISLV